VWICACVVWSVRAVRSTKAARLKWMDSITSARYDNRAQKMIKCRMGRRLYLQGIHDAVVHRKLPYRHQLKVFVNILETRMQPLHAIKETNARQRA